MMQSNELSDRSAVASVRSATIVASGDSPVTCSTSLDIDRRAAEALRVRAVADLEHAAADERRVLGQESLDVVAVDRGAAVEAEGGAHR